MTSAVHERLSSQVVERAEHYTLQDICELQQEDDTVGPVLEAMEAAKKPSPDDIAGKRREIGYLLQLWDQ